MPRTKAIDQNPLATLVWYMKRPRLYKEFIRKVILKARHAPIICKAQNKDLDANSFEYALNGSGEYDPRTALSKLFGSKMAYDDFAHVESSRWNYACAKRDACPVQMGGGIDISFIFSLVENLKAKIVVETGVAFGWSSLAILTSVSRRDGHLISVDRPYIGRNNDNYVGTVVPKDLHKYWTLMRYPDRDALPKLKSKNLVCDLVHYDSDKSYEGRGFAYPILWDLLREGGVFISDDVYDNSAFLEFSKQVNRNPIFVSTNALNTRRHGVCGILQK